MERLDLGLARAETRGGPTDAAGTTVVRLPAGSWFLVARSEGRAAAEGEATVAPGRDSGVVRLVLWPACTLDGVVLSAPGRPRSGGEVQAVAAGSGGLPASRAAVDGSGRFRLAGLRPGRHSLSYAPRAGVVLSVGVVEVPGAAHVEILAAGEPTDLPPAIWQALAERRSQSIRHGPWVERHYRPDQPR